jgi:hypothetical protein
MTVQAHATAQAAELGQLIAGRSAAAPSSENPPAIETTR